MLERDYQKHVIRRVRTRWTDGIVLKNDSSYRQGIPDLSVFFPTGFWAWLEVKPSESAIHEPNQDYYVEWAGCAMFGAFIYPENEDEVLDDLQQAYQLFRHPCIPIGQ